MNKIKYLFNLIRSSSVKVGQDTYHAMGSSIVSAIHSLPYLYFYPRMSCLRQHLVSDIDSIYLRYSELM